MKTTSSMKEDIYRELEASGYLKNVQAQIKSHVFEVVHR